MKRFLPILIAGAMLMLSACAAKQLPPPQWTYEKDAIRMHIKADDKLNLDEGEAHTLLLCAYQLSDPNTFIQLSNDQDGLYKLLECSLFGDGAAASKRMIIQPGTGPQHDPGPGGGAPAMSPSLPGTISWKKTVW